MKYLNFVKEYMLFIAHCSLFIVHEILLPFQIVGFLQPLYLVRCNITIPYLYNHLIPAVGVLKGYVDFMISKINVTSFDFTQ